MRRTTNAVSRIEAKLAAITALVDRKAERDFLRLVEALRQRRSAAALGVLLAQVRDTEHDMMEIIMQSAETFPLKMYFTVLARELVALYARAPYRTSIFLSRILQAPRDLPAFVTALEGAGPELQHVIAACFEAIRDDRPDLAARMKRVERAVRERRRLRE